MYRTKRAMAAALPEKYNINDMSNNDSMAAILDTSGTSQHTTISVVSESAETQDKPKGPWWPYKSRHWWLLGAFTFAFIVLVGVVLTGMLLLQRQYFVGLTADHKVDLLTMSSDVMVLRANFSKMMDHVTEMRNHSTEMTKDMADLRAMLADLHTAIGARKSDETPKEVAAKQITEWHKAFKSQNGAGLMYQFNAGLLCLVAFMFLL